MKNIRTRDLPISGVMVISYERYTDRRGYFSESFRKSELIAATQGAVGSWEVVQANESYSRAGTIRGLHFQWSPFMGKLVRTITGRMIDLILDIRVRSPTFGTILAHDMPAVPESDRAEWIWVPPGCAHGNLFSQDTVIEYLCSAEYNGASEAGISPLSKDINWNSCDPSLKALFDAAVKSERLILSDKDRNGLSLEAWRSDSRSLNFVYGEET